MLHEALSSADVVAEQRVHAGEKLEMLADKLRERPRTLVLTVARGSSDTRRTTSPTW